MSRRTDYLHPLTQEEIADLMEQAERLHALDIRWVLVTLVAIVAFFVLCGEASASLAAFSLLIPSACTGRCNQGLQCTCSDILDSVDSSALDVGQLIASGAMEAPQVSDRQPLLRRFWAWLTAPEVEL